MEHEGSLPCLHQSPLVPILSKMNPVQAFPFYLFKIYFNIYFKIYFNPLKIITGFVFV